MTTERTPTAAREGFTVRRPMPQTAPTPRMTSRELWGMARAAAAQVMRGKSYSPDDRADVAAQVVADIIGTYADRHPAPRPYRAGTFPLTREDALMAFLMDRDMSRPATAAVRRAEDVFYIPVAARSYVRMTNRALTLRRSIDRQRARDLAAAEETATASEGFTVRPAHETVRPDSPTAEAARDRAMDMLAALGLPRLGKAYPLAFTAARTYMAREAHRETATVENQHGETATAEAGRTTGYARTVVRDSDLARAAAELGYRSPEALTMAAKRAAAKIPSVAVYSPDAHGAALGLEVEAAPARKASATRMHSADMGDRANGWRTAPAEPAPILLRAGKVTAAAPPAWTRDLPPATAARLSGAAKVRRQRMDAKTAAQRAADRERAGLPA